MSTHQKIAKQMTKSSSKCGCFMPNDCDDAAGHDVMFAAVSPCVDWPPPSMTGGTDLCLEYYPRSAFHMANVGPELNI